MAEYICIDGGTTNTRIALVKNGTVADTEHLNIDSGKSENNALLKKAVKSGIEHILEKHGTTPKAVITSGMITGGGLCETPHIPAPAGLKELHNAISVRYIPEICDIPFAFIPGVKTVSRAFENADIMRGEETSLWGWISIYQVLSFYCRVRTQSAFRYQNTGK